jgi:hypothetical protein
MDDQFKKNEMGEAFSAYVGQESFGGETFAKRPFGKCRGSWEDKIKMDLQ